MTDWKRKYNYKKQQNKLHGIHITQQQQQQQNSNEINENNESEVIHTPAEDLIYQQNKGNNQQNYFYCSRILVGITVIFFSQCYTMYSSTVCYSCCA